MRLFLHCLTLFICSIFSLTFYISSAAAYERISNPYQASVLIADRGSDSRDKAISQGLEQVLIRYTGYSGVAGFAGVEAELRSAQRYVIEYGVETVVVPADDKIGTKQTDALWVRYNANLVEQLVGSLELPIWPTLRPTVSYIVVSELWGKPYIPTPVDFPALDAYMKTIFDSRGIVATRIDESSFRGVSAEALWNIDEGLLQNLKAQTVSDVLAVIRSTPEYDNSYELEFILVDESSETLITRNSHTLFSAIGSGLNFYIDTLSSELSFLGGTNIEQDVYLRVAGMRSYPEYKVVLNQIAGLEQVLSVRMDSARDDSVGYLVRYQSNLALLIEAITTITDLKPFNRLLEEQDGYAIENIPSQVGSAEQPLLFAYPKATFISDLDMIERQSYSSNQGSVNPDNLVPRYQRSVESVDEKVIPVIDGSLTPINPNVNN